MIARICNCKQMQCARSNPVNISEIKSNSPGVFSTEPWVFVSSINKYAYPEVYVEI